MEIIIKRLKKFGFRNFIFSVGYKAHLIEAYFQDGKNLYATVSGLFRNNADLTYEFDGSFKVKISD